MLLFTKNVFIRYKKQLFLQLAIVLKRRQHIILTTTNNEENHQRNLYQLV